jgi:hypothetical protein
MGISASLGELSFSEYRTKINVPRGASTCLFGDCTEQAQHSRIRMYDSYSTLHYLQLTLTVGCPLSNMFSCLYHDIKTFKLLWDGM